MAHPHEEQYNSAMLLTGTVAARGVLRPPRLLGMPAADCQVRAMEEDGVNFATTSSTERRPLAPVAPGATAKDAALQPTDPGTTPRKRVEKALLSQSSVVRRACGQQRTIQQISVAAPRTAQGMRECTLQVALMSYLVRSKSSRPIQHRRSSTWQ